MPFLGQEFKANGPAIWGGSRFYRDKLCYPTCPDRSVRTPHRAPRVLEAGTLAARLSCRAPREHSEQRGCKVRLRQGSGV